MNERQWIWRILGIIGLALVVAGSVAWGVAAGAIDRAQSLYWFTRTLSGKAAFADGGGMASANVWEWLGIVAVAVGVALLVTVAIVFAATARDGFGPWTRFDLDGARLGDPRLGATGLGGGRFGRASAAGPASLTELVAMHDRGALTDLEFTAAKRRLLGL